MRSTRCGGESLAGIRRYHSPSSYTHTPHGPGRALENSFFPLHTHSSASLQPSPSFQPAAALHCSPSSFCKHPFLHCPKLRSLSAPPLPTRTGDDGKSRRHVWVQREVPRGCCQSARELPTGGNTLVPTVRYMNFPRLPVPPHSGCASTSHLSKSQTISTVSDQDVSTLKS